MSSLTFSSSMKKQTTCGMVAHKHGPVKSSSEFCFGFLDVKIFTHLITWFCIYRDEENSDIARSTVWELFQFRTLYDLVKG